MGILDLQKMKKLKIEACDPRDGSRLGGGFASINPFEAMFNPASYTIAYQNRYSKRAGLGSGGAVPRFYRSTNFTASFKLVIDGTAIGAYNVGKLFNKKTNVAKEVQHFLQLAGWINGNVHQPNLLKIIWTDVVFVCRLESVQISYTLFNESGKPLRAELDVTFIEDISEVRRLMIQANTSPDLTHKRIVQAYETLPLMCERIYGSALYYLQVAKANRLDDFRNLKPGQELFFPPIKNDK